MTPSFSDAEAGATPEPAAIPMICVWPSLLERFEGDRELIRELVALFREEAATNLPRLERSARTGDAPGVLNVAHSLRGSVSNFEAPAAVALLAKIEEAAKAHDTDDALARLPDLKSLLDGLLRELDARLDP